MPAMRQTRRAPAKRAAAPRQRQRSAPRRADGSGWTMKLGAWAHARMRAAQHDNVTRRFLMGATIVSVVAILMVLAAGLGVLDNMGRAISDSAANTARNMGLAVRVVNVQAPIGLEMSEYQRAEAQAIAGIVPDEVMFGVDPSVIRARVADLPWVENVMVRRLWPDQIQIVITPRAASALWQENGKLTYMDATGRKLGAANVTSAKGLALVVGKGAGPAAPALFAALGPNQEVASRTSAAIRVGDRRWTLRMKSGGDILLPETDFAGALAQLNQLQVSHKLLDRPYGRLDIRTPGTLILRPPTLPPTTEVLSVNASMVAAKPARGV
jgi:cell division protein FtsQ